jgi:chromosome partitioning protein
VYHYLYKEMLHSQMTKESLMTSRCSNNHLIAVANLKGGVGKTTTVLNLAGFAGQIGKRVLAVDTDPQASLTRVALPDDAPSASLTDAFARRARTLNGVRCPSRFAGVDLVPSTLALEAVIQAAIPWEGREYVLLDMLTPHLEEYDLILIDCRPGIDLSVTNALTVARWLLVPVECSFMALDGYEHVHALQQRLNQRINPELALLGLLPTRYRSGTAHAQTALADIQRQVEDLQLPLRFAPIRLAVAAADAPAQGMTLADFAPSSAIAQEYRRTSEQILRFLEDQR